MIDMKMLLEVAPTVHREFAENINHTVTMSSSESSLNSVSPLEQLLGFQAWKIHETDGHVQFMMAATTMEVGSQRMERDENDVQNVITCIETKTANPFDVS